MRNERISARKGPPLEPEFSHGRIFRPLDRPPKSSAPPSHAQRPESHAGRETRPGGRPSFVLRRPLGTLAVGREADVTIINPNRRWTVKVDQWRSRSRNCPYDGWKLTARAVATIVAGRVKYDG